MSKTAIRTKEVTGIFVREKFRNEDFVIGEIRVGDTGKRMAVLGEAQDGELIPQLTYHFYGQTEESQYGPQIRFRTFVRAQPHGEEAVVRYLQEAPGVGPVAARSLWDKFKSDAVRLLREDPEAAAIAANARGFTAEKAAIAAEYLQEQAALENCMMELIGLFDRRGFPKNAPMMAFRKWSGKAPEIAKRNPFKLMALPGIGFGTADQMYLELGHFPGRLRRQMYCGIEAVKAHCRNGHTWTPIEVFADGIKAKVSGAELRPAQALKLALNTPGSPLVRIRRDCPACFGKPGSCKACGGTGGKLWIAERHKADAEELAAKIVGSAMVRESHSWPAVTEEGFPTLKSHQREQAGAALQGPISLLTGYPGTGKTYTVAQVAKQLIKQHGQGQIAISAPTGKASVRCTEVMNKMGVPIQASTIHRMLGVESLDEGHFRHNSANPLPYRFVIFDEASMIDTPLMRSILNARPRGAQYLFVGDPNQLPPVGHGAPLRDMIAAGVPCGRLVDIERNSGSIVRVCKAVCEGGRPEFDSSLDLDAGKNLRLIEANKAFIFQKCLEIVRTIRDQRLYGLDPIWDTQMIVAVNDRSPVSRKLLNQALQQELNPRGQSVKGSPFRVGDKVIQLSNQFLPTYDVKLGQTVDANYISNADELDVNSKGQALVCNGEFGRVLEVHEKKTVVQFFSPNRVVLIPRGKSDSDAGCDLDLGYAATCHKMQGSEVRCAIVVLDEYPGAVGNFGICTREWFTTAITRGRDMTLCVGREETAMKMIRRTALPSRKTFMRELIEHEIGSQPKAIGGQSWEQQYQTA